MSIFALAVLSGGEASAASHVVKEGEYLSKIAIEKKTTWEKIWSLNSDIQDPNLIFVGQELEIPGEEATEPRREQPVCDEETQWVRADNGECLDKPANSLQPASAPVQEVVEAPAIQPAQTYSEVAPSSSVGGPNAYAYGYCTWHVKNLRPDIGGYWGDGNQWVASAQAAGYATGPTPRVGAIGSAVAYNHVAYVTAVNGDGTIIVSEMNYEGHGIVSTRTASASEFYYIY